jgi:hypothetical protein
MSEKKPAWILYHVLTPGVVVAQPADHHDHLLQHHTNKGLPTPYYIAGSMEPLPAAQIAALEKQYNVKFKAEMEPELPPFVVPEQWKKNREDWAAKIKARKAAQKVG